MPGRLVVHDRVGHEVAKGVVESWRGAALWHCNTIASGQYILALYDAAGILISTATIIKQ
jgi:hypothetical protein